MLNKQAEEVSGRVLSARAGAPADQVQMGERLHVVDPPVVPDTPISPNRPLIVAIGTAAGIVLGFIMVFGLEFLARPIRDPAALAKITGSRPLATIPVYATHQQERGSSFQRGLKPLNFWSRRRQLSTTRLS
jgi:polysaccharide biosynthesis transport protein